MTTPISKEARELHDLLWPFMSEETGLELIQKAFDAIAQRGVPDDAAIMRALFKHFNESGYKPLICTRWKDGIDIDSPTYALQAFVKELFAAASPAPVSEPDGMTAELNEALNSQVQINAEILQERDKLAAQNEALKRAMNKRDEQIRQRQKHG